MVPESRWIKHAAHQEYFFGETTEHYEEHGKELAGDPRGRVVSGQPGNGHFDPADDDGLDDDAPLDAAEEAAAAAEALAEADESLDERVEGVVEDLDGVTRRRDGESR